MDRNLTRLSLALPWVILAVDWKGSWAALRAPKGPNPRPLFVRGEGRDPDEAGAKNRGGIPPQEPAKRRGSGLSHRSRKDDKNPDLNGVKIPGQKGPMGSGRELVEGIHGPINGCIPGPTKGQFGDGHSRFPLKAPFGPGNLAKSHGGKAARRTVQMGTAKA